MPNPVLGVIGLGVGQSALQNRANRRATDAQTSANQDAISEQRAARESFEQRTQPFVDLGTQAGSALSDFLGFGEGGPQSQIDEINPVLSFLRDEGFEDIQESAAARNRLGAGGTLKDLTEFNTNLAATIVPQLQNQRFNQLFNVLGAGSNAATAQGTAGLQTANNVGNLLQSSGRARADGVINKSNILTDLISTGTQAVGFGGNPFNFLTSQGST